MRTRVWGGTLSGSFALTRILVSTTHSSDMRHPAPCLANHVFHYRQPLVRGLFHEMRGPLLYLAEFVDLEPRCMTRSVGFLVDNDDSHVVRVQPSPCSTVSTRVDDRVPNSKQKCLAVRFNNHALAASNEVDQEISHCELRIRMKMDLGFLNEEKPAFFSPQTFDQDR